jgi:hypothetical protein
VSFSFARTVCHVSGVTGQLRVEMREKLRA